MVLPRAAMVMVICWWIFAPPFAHAQGRLSSADFFALRSVGDVRFSPDGTRIAYTVNSNPQNGRPSSQVWIADVASGRSVRVGGDDSRGSQPAWSPDGRWLAFVGSTDGETSGLVVARGDGATPELLAPMQGTNSSALVNTGHPIAWAPDGRRLAFVSATPGPETAEAEGDPRVIRRFLYKPTASEGDTRFNDNRRLHIFVIERDTKTVRQLTDGRYDEHSIDWSPGGAEILFVSNREPDSDEFFNNDVFALTVADGRIRRITATEGVESRPHWSPDGKWIAYQATKRGLTDLETNMEDAHVWIAAADGSQRRELGATIDNRQGPPEWAANGQSVYATVQERGTVRLYRLPIDGGTPRPVVAERGGVGAFSLAADGSVAYAFTSASDLAQLFVLSSSGTRALTSLNERVLGGKELAEVTAFTFISNDHKFEVEAFLTKPLGMTATSTHPMIALLHGGPHGQQGPAFNVQAQVYAARGWATLMVNFRGSTGYGQAFADAVFRDQNGDEAQDVLYAVSAAIRRNAWIDRNRLGVEGTSYGGQLTAWLITQTHIFKAAIPRAAITNLVSYNYMSYYNQYEEMTFGVRPHQRDLMDELWRRSALRHVAQVKTPTMIVHGENDNDVPIAESEQFYIALKDVGVETIMVRYPREGHGLREPQHVVDNIDRSIRWYEDHFK